MRLSDDKKTVTKDIRGGINVCYGNITIKSNSNFIYTWSIQINHGGDGIFVIGISADWKKTDLAFYKQRHFDNYGYNGYSGWKVSKGSFKPFHRRYGTNDVIHMILNMKEGTLSFKRNNEKQKLAYKVAKSNNIEYKLGIGLLDRKDSVTIIDFNQRKA